MKTTVFCVVNRFSSLTNDKQHTCTGMILGLAQPMRDAVTW